jgi:hypothetical protein
MLDRETVQCLRSPGEPQASGVDLPGRLDISEQPLRGPSGTSPGAAADSSLRDCDVEDGKIILKDPTSSKNISTAAIPSADSPGSR